ncbi:hypothetical protein Cni_G01068 [Canna indica]|uniref:C2H2-type domain-containing protein n=1 Tax=Canna indica TaxID=4628 RepID=A0AAQ3Q1B6_9LILI|nr:hypothetical protein Cni_G01068 [Canna indica]
MHPPSRASAETGSPPPLPLIPTHKLPDDLPPIHHSAGVSSLAASSKPPRLDLCRMPNLDSHSAAGITNTTSKPTCTVCCKPFLTLKALCGHMRTHPERQWRGINPASYRRRHPPITPCPTPVDAFTEKEREVSDILLTLIHLPPRFPCPVKTDGDVNCGACSLATAEAATSSGYSCGNRKRAREEEEEGGMRCSSSSRMLDIDLNFPPPMENNE